MRNNRIDNVILVILIIVIVYFICSYDMFASKNNVDYNDYSESNYTNNDNVINSYVEDNNYYNINNYSEYLNQYDNYVENIENTYDSYFDDIYHPNNDDPVQSDTSAQNSITPEKTDTFFYKYYYNQINSRQQKIYQTLEKGCAEYNSVIKLDREPISDVTVAAYSLSMDHPELFWISNYNYKVLNNEYVVEISYDIPSGARDTSQKIETKVAEILNDMRSKNIYREYDKLRFFYEWIINNTEYGDTADSQEITSVFINNVSVCSGYSKAFLYLCQKSGIECACVAGYTNSNEKHAWNLVKLDNNYYWVDSTWGDPVFAGEHDKKPNYNYFMVDDSELLKNHQIENKIQMLSSARVDKTFTYPSCSDKSLNYYRQKGCYFDYYSQYAISNYLKNNFKDNIYSDIELKFSNLSDYNSFIHDFIKKEDAQIYKDIKDVNPYFYGTVYISYETIESADYVKITVTLE